MSFISSVHMHPWNIKSFVLKVLYVHIGSNMNKKHKKLNLKKNI